MKERNFQDFNAKVCWCNPYSYYFYAYDLESKVSTVPVMQTEDEKEFRMGFNCSMVLHGNKLYFIGGTDKLDDYGNKCYYYSFMHNKVYPISGMLKKKREHSVIAAGGHIYCVGGWDSQEQLSDCEKIYVGYSDGPAEHKWESIKPLKAPKSAVSLCCLCPSKYNDSPYIYAIAGLAKDNEYVPLIERFNTVSDDPNSTTWEEIKFQGARGFFVGSPTVGSFMFLSGPGEQTIIVFSGEAKKEDSKAFKFTLTKDKNDLSETDCPNLAGQGSLHARRPVYTNGGDDIYFVGFYDIMHFSTRHLLWVEPTVTHDWVHYK
jgi:hypothetical protein